MIREEVIQRIWQSTCSVIRLKAPYNDLMERCNESELHEQLTGAVVGTGFMVSDKEVLTNFHIFEEMLKDFQDHGTMRNWVVRFIYPQPDGEMCSNLTARVRRGFGIPYSQYDVALFEICVDSLESNPVEFGDLDELSIGAEVGICGFPAGDVLLSNPSLGLNRWGPLVFQGMISGVAPFPVADKRTLTRFITDINSFGGFSGSPIFDATDGRVIGLHHAGIASTCGIAIPVDRQRVDTWLRAFHEGRNPEIYGIHESSKTMRFSLGGDFEGWN